MLRWEFMAMSDFRPRLATDSTMVEKNWWFFQPSRSHNPERNHSFLGYNTSHYTSKCYPECTADFIGHFLIVVEAFNEVEHPAMREYDEAYRGKIASTGNKSWSWSGMDVTLYQELCGLEQKQRLERKEIPRGTGGNGLCWGGTSLSCIMIKYARILHASFHTYTCIWIISAWGTIQTLLFQAWGVRKLRMVA